jgi:hypothetical protein
MRERWKQVKNSPGAIDNSVAVKLARGQVAADVASETNHYGPVCSFAQALDHFAVLVEQVAPRA